MNLLDAGQAFAALGGEQNGLLHLYTDLHTPLQCLKEPAIGDAYYVIIAM